MGNAETSNQRVMKPLSDIKAGLGGIRADNTASLKPVEDMLNDQNVGLGDDTAAIWVPQQVDRQNH